MEIFNQSQVLGREVQSVGVLGHVWEKFLVLGARYS